MAELLRRIRSEDEGAYEKLYSLVRRTVLASLRAEFHQETEDVGHDIFMDLLSAIRLESIRHPEAVVLYLRTMILRRRSELISQKIHDRRQTELALAVPCAAPRADQMFEEAEQWQVITASLSRLDATKREILERFYFEHQSRDQIITDMKLTETKYRQFKSRGLATLCQHVETRTAKTFARAV